MKLSVRSMTVSPESILVSTLFFALFILVSAEGDEPSMPPCARFLTQSECLVDSSCFTCRWYNQRCVLAETNWGCVIGTGVAALVGFLLAGVLCLCGLLGCSVAYNKCNHETESKPLLSQ
jgi:hypothetical protein